MKNFLKYYLLLMFIFVSQQVLSQKKNSVKLYTQGLDFPSYSIRYPNIRLNGFENINMNTILGISLERQINTRFGFGGQYMFWWGKSLIHGQNKLGYRFIYITSNQIGESSIGDLLEGYQYKTFDIYGIYKIDLKQKMQLSSKIGPSVTRGENEYLTKFRYYGTEPPLDYTWETEVRKETYYGGFTGLSFDYLLWEKRIPVGLDLNARYYHNFPFQINYGLHAGFNF